jgi:hypothetical protein
MRRLHYLVTPLVAWFFLLYNIERLIEPINLASFVYVYTALCAILLVSLPRFKQLSTLWLIALLLGVYLILKNQLGYEIAGQYLPITITEMSAIAITVFMSDFIGRRLEQLQETLTNLAVAELSDEVKPFGTGQGQIYREVRRARRYQRPLALLAISVTDESFKVSQDHFARAVPLHRFLGEVQREIMKKYIATRLGNLLVEVLEDSAVVTQRDSHFVTLLPETAREDITNVLKKLESAAEEKLGLKLKIGVSTFPDRAVTFETMLEQAEAEMMRQAPLTNGHVTLIPTGVKKLSSS